MNRAFRLGVEHGLDRSVLETAAGHLRVPLERIGAGLAWWPGTPAW